MPDSDTQAAPKPGKKHGRLQSLDRPTVQLITTKRLVTGTASLLSALVLLIFGLFNWQKLAGDGLGLWLVGLLLLSVGGAWQLRDGLRGRKALRGEP